MNASTPRLLRSLAVLGLLVTVGLLVLATVTGAATIGPATVWAVHTTLDAEGSTVAIRPGVGLALVWAALAVTAGVATAVRRRGSARPGRSHE